MLCGFQGLQEPGQPPAQQPDKVGWVRKFCGRGIFRELWRNRFVVLRGERLYISEKEVSRPSAGAPDWCGVPAQRVHMTARS